MSTEASFPGGKAAGALNRIHFHLVKRSKNARNYTSTPPIRLHGVVLSSAQGQLYLYVFILKSQKT
jgi:hypothetical protein